MKWNFSSIKRILGYVRPYRIQWGLGNLCYIVGLCMFTVCTAKSMEKFLDAIVNKDAVLMKTGIYLLLTALLLMFLLEGSYKKLFGEAMACIRTDMQNTIFQKLLRVPLCIQEKTTSAEGLVLLNQDVEQALGFLGDNLTTFLSSIVMLFTSVICIGKSSIWLGLYCMFIFIALIVTNMILVPKHQRLAQDVLEEQEKINSLFASIREGGVTIRTGILGRLVENIFEKKSNILLDYKSKRRILEFRQNLLVNGLSQLLVLVPILVGVVMCSMGKMTVGVLFFNFNFTMNMSGYAGQLCNSAIALSKSQASLKRFFKIVDKKSEDKVSGIKDIKAQEGVKYCLELSGVHVELGEKVILDQLDLKVRPGEFVVLAGKSGGGKSTFIQFLLGFVDYTGEYRINGKEKSEYSIGAFRSFFSYVPQNPILFSGTIYENIAYGNCKASEKDIRNVVHLAGLEDFLQRLPEGIHTHVGEAGERLSGGERQRIAIARALLKGAPILLLDECTSALDYETEAKILDTIQKIGEEKTIIMVGHRKSVIQSGHRLLVLSDNCLKGGE